MFHAAYVHDVDHKFPSVSAKYCMRYFSGAGVLKKILNPVVIWSIEKTMAAKLGSIYCLNLFQTSDFLGTPLTCLMYKYLYMFVSLFLATFF